MTTFSSHKKKSVRQLFSKEVSQEKLILFTSQLTELVKAKLPLFQSLTALSQQAEGEKIQPIIQSLMEQIKEGRSLSDALNLYPKHFSSLYRALIRAGEKIGALDKSLEKLTLLLTKSAKLKKKITTALLYPLILALFSSFVILVMLFFVIPSLETLFEKESLHGCTAFVIGVSHFFRKGWPYFIPLLVGTIALCSYLFKKPIWKERKERCLLKTPLVRTILIKIAVARFTRTLSSLLEGGVVMIEALRIAKSVVAYPLLEKELSLAEQKIIEGSSLSKELTKVHWMPRLVGQMASVGEESGSLFTMLESVAQMYEEDVDKNLTRMAELAQPIILLVMGAIVGLIMLAILIPMSDASHIL